MTVTANKLSKALKKLADVNIAKHSQRFFKTGEGEYGYGDKFLGIRVPELRKLAKANYQIELQEVERLLKSSFHEQRMLALFLLVEKYERGSSQEKCAVYKLYLNNTRYINNWDLVDCSAYKIVGPYLWEKKRNVLYKLSQSEILWERRISIMSTFYFIKQHDFDDTLKISSRLLNDEHDLIHKAVGWMLREIGNRNLAVEMEFLKIHYKKMPRTMLRYAIEKFPKHDRKAYLYGHV